MHLTSFRKNLFVQLCFFLSFSFCHAAAGRINFNHLSDFPELSNNIVFSMVQDNRGFIWFGTYDGLYKYDGNSLKNYSSNSLNGNSLPTVPVRALFIDPSGEYMWIGTSGRSLWRMSLKTELFQDYKLLHESLRALSDNVADICEDRDHNIWLSTIDNGVNMINMKSNILHIYRSPMKYDVARCICDSRGRIKVTDIIRCVYVYDSTKDCFIQSKVNENHDVLQFVAQHRTGNADISQNKSKKNSFPFDVLNDALPYRPVIKDRKGMIWIGTDFGLFSYDARTKNVESYCSTFSDAGSLNGNIVYAFLEDASGNLWIGTDMGINKISFSQQDFSNFSFDANDNIDTRYIRSIYVDRKGTIWLGTFRGSLNYIDKNNKLHHFKADKSFPNVINAIGEEKNGNLWFCGQPAFAVIDKNYTLISDGKVYAKLKKQNSNPIWSFLADSEGNIWIGTKNDLLRVNSRDKSCAGYLSHAGDKNSLAGTSVWCLFKDYKGTIWVGTNNGLSRIYSEKGRIQFQNYLPGPNKPGALLAHNIWYIHEDKQHLLWMATSDYGLWSFDPDKNIFRNYDERNGFPTNMICGILEDSQARLWISTNKGLCLFDPLLKKVTRVFSESDGLFGSQFNYKCCFKDRSGRMFFGAKTGFVSFYPDKIKIQNYEPAIMVSSFKVAYRENIQRFLNDSALSLSYPDKDFSIDFSSTDFSNPAQSQFAYKLIGLSDKWVDLGHLHSVTISNLSPGKYQLLLRTRNSSGQWGAHVFKAGINVLPPFWRTWWFVSLALSCIITGIFITVRYFIAKKESQRRKLFTELSILRSQLNPHFIFNSLNSLQSFIITYKNDLALDYVERFAHIMRLILENSRKNVIPLSEEITFLELYFYMESLRAGNKIKFELVVDDNLKSGNIMIPPMLVQPFVENSLKHGQLTSLAEGRVSVSFKALDDYFEVVIEDNGVGRKIAEKSTNNRVYKKESIGIGNIVARLNIINRNRPGKNAVQVIDLYHQSGESAGTRVEMIIPYL